MNKKSILVALAVVVLAIGAIFVLNNARVKPTPAGQITEVTSANAQQVIASSKVPVYVLISADNCADCNKLESMLAQSATKFSGKMLFVKINITKSPDLAPKGVTAKDLPLSIIIDPTTGAQAGPFAGAAPDQGKLDAVIQRVLDQIDQLKQQQPQGDPGQQAPAAPAQPNGN